MATEVLTSIVAVVIVLGIMILVHEWGHFMAAKLFGVRVEVFSLGFGPRLWGRRRGPTDYRISALPLGGYVKMAGDNPAEERTGAPDEFLSKPRWQRAIIAVAGPTMNLLAAIVLLVGSFLAVGVPTPAYLTRPVEVVAFPKKSVGAGPGLQPGDRVVAIDGIKNPTWEKARLYLIGAKPGTEVDLVLSRAGEEVRVNFTPPDPRDVDAVLGYPPIPATVEQVAPGMPAERAGLRSDDEIVALNSEPVLTWPQLVEAIRHSNGHPLELTVRRGDRRTVLHVKPVQGQDSRGETVWQIGALYRPEVVYQHLSFAAAVEQGVLVTAGATDRKSVV